mmetsp:Transcript_19180/g.23604  ORF Transcript_19180/g.23604 Transcript_19180/m.23604 type:complete len:701 (-) Transcript_19180:1699-3801(-)
MSYRLVYYLSRQNKIQNTVQYDTTLKHAEIKKYNKNKSTRYSYIVMENNINHLQQQQEQYPEHKSVILSDDLNRHYESHGVVGIETFMNQGKDVSLKQKNIHRKEDRNTITASLFLDSDSYSDSDSYTKNKASLDEVKSATFTTPLRKSRFIRLNPRYDETETLDLLSSELPPQIKPIQVPWLSPKLSFYAIPSSFSLVKSSVFQHGRIYGMDVSSGAAVAALLLDDHDYLDRDKLKTLPSTSSSSSPSSSLRILDLCCAPGLKTCAIADLYTKKNHNDDKSSKKQHQKQRFNNVTIIGVDISQSRIQLCKNIIHKYHIDDSTRGCVVNSHSKSNSNSNSNSNSRHQEEEGSKVKVKIQLYCTDGTTYGTQTLEPSSLIFDSDVGLEEEQTKGKRKRMNKSARARQQKKLRALVHDEQQQQQQLKLKLKLMTKNPQVQQPISCNTQNTHHTSTTCTSKVEDHQSQDDINFVSNEPKPTSNCTIPLFDRVLVDAECSTDGAIRHLQHKHKHKNNKNQNRNETKDEDGNNIKQYDDNVVNNFTLTDSNKLAELVKLQKKLIQSGYKLLKPGGILVYSTCSLSTNQNEDVVSWLLEEYKEEAFIIPVSFSNNVLPHKGHVDKINTTQCNSNSGLMIYEGSLDGTVRFRPNLHPSDLTHCSVDESTRKKCKVDSDLNINTTRTEYCLYGGGFFLAKIGKKETKL